MPKCSLREYRNRIIKYTYDLPDVEEHARLLLRKLHSTAPLCDRDRHRALLGCFFIASKVLEDNTYTIQHMANVGGVSSADLHDIEVYILTTLEWDVSIPLPVANIDSK